tara:strand:- start:362 stop:484 length:123 start_codon:yes stop_codon:yes gene_type:complete
VSSTLELFLRLIWFVVGWGLGFLALLAVYLAWEAYRGSRP